MDTNIKNSLLLAGSAIAGGAGGSWAATRLGAAFGLSLGPWGSAAGAMLGAMASTALAKRMLGEPQAMLEAQPDVEAAPESEPQEA
jgi:uncharacterized membrane protein YdjX (TVP38/TMEM64 family)